MKTSQIAVVTMVYGDDFIKKWVNHYSKEVGPENLFIISHGSNAYHDEVSVGANHIVIPRAFSKNFDAARFRLINQFCNALLEVYHAVIFTDVDEFILPDPALETTLLDYLLRYDSGVVAPIGLNVVTPETGMPLDWDRPILSQACLAFYHPAFSKPAIRFSPCRLIQGGHRLAENSFIVDPNLWLFHLKFADSTLHTRYDTLIEDLNAVYGPEAEGRGVLQWKKDKEKVKVFLENLRKKTYPEMTPKENTVGFLKVVPDEKKRSFGVDQSERTTPFLLAKSVRSSI